MNLYKKIGAVVAASLLTVSTGAVAATAAPAASASSLSIANAVQARAGVRTGKKNEVAAGVPAFVFIIGGAIAAYFFYTEVIDDDDDSN